MTDQGLLPTSIKEDLLDILFKLVISIIISFVITIFIYSLIKIIDWFMKNLKDNEYAQFILLFVFLTIIVFIVTSIDTSERS